MSCIKLYRLMGILLLLESKKHITAKDLAERFEVSIRTIYRDLDILSETGIPIVTESGPGGGISLMAGYQFNMNTMDQNELSSMIKTIADGDLFLQTDEISKSMLLKVRQALPIEKQNQFDRLMRSIKVDNTTWQGNEVVSVENKQLLDTLKQSILEKVKVMFDYKSYQSTTLNRVVHPYGLVKKAKAWYLVGYCEERQEVRVFNLMRIQNIKSAGARFESLDGFDLNVFWEKTINSFQEKNIAQRSVPPIVTETFEPKYPVKLKLEEINLGMLKGFSVVNQEIKDGQVELTVDLLSEHIAISQLFLQLDQMVILQPAELREIILDKMKKIIEKQSC